jgi:hypothetical protein
MKFLCVVVVAIDVVRRIMEIIPYYNLLNFML